MTAKTDKVELVWLYLRMADRAEAAIEDAREASFEGDSIGDRAAMRKANAFSRICESLAKEIRETIPGFNFMQAEAWLEANR